MGVVKHEFLRPTQLDLESLPRDAVDDFTNSAVFEQLFHAIKLGTFASEYRAEDEEVPEDLEEAIATSAYVLQRLVSVQDVLDDN